MARQNLRRRERRALPSIVRVGWQDRLGQNKSVETRSFDISESGLRFDLPEAVQLRSDVTLRSEKLGLNTRASVRFCTRKGTRYVIGVEFAGNFRWRPPTDEIRRELEASALLALPEPAEQ